jgi:hypothetical protein
MTVTTKPLPSSRRSAPTTAAAPAAASSPLTRLTGAAFVAAPVVLLSSSLAWSSDVARGVLGFYACAIFVLVIVTLTQAIAVQFPRAAVALTVLGLLGAAAGVGFNIDNIHGALFDDTYIVDEGGLASVLVANVPGLMFPLAWVGIGVALLRGGVQPRFSAITLIVAGALFPVARIGDVAPLAIVDDLLFCVALAPLGLAIMQGRGLLPARAGS